VLAEGILEPLQGLPGLAPHSGHETSIARFLVGVVVEMEGMVMGVFITVVMVGLPFAPL
jgi:hypothetical protein